MTTGGSTSIPAALAHLRDGRPVVVTDDGRDRHGVLVVAAALISAPTMAFVVRESSGLVCVAMTQQGLDRLRLPPLATRPTPNRAIGASAVSVDLREGVSTGISARDRAATLRALADPESDPADFTRPGHVLPVAAAAGGVLEQPGISEAAVDLCLLADLPPAAAVAALTTDAGDVAGDADIRSFAADHDLAVVTISDVVAARHAREYPTPGTAQDAGGGRGDNGSVNPAMMRDVLGHFVSGIAVVTAAGPDGPIGFTCQSFASLSLDPPLVSLSPARSSSTWPRIREVGTFCVNVLASDHHHYSAGFARSGVDKFAGVRWLPAPSGAPVLDGVSAWIDCSLEHEYDGGDHTIVVARVHDMGANARRLPLLFYRGGYGGIADIGGR